MGKRWPPLLSTLHTHTQPGGECPLDGTPMAPTESHPPKLFLFFRSLSREERKGEEASESRGWADKVLAALGTCGTVLRL